MKTTLPRTILAIALIIYTSVWLVGCSSSTGTITRAPSSQFSFVGNTQDALIAIDDRPPVALDRGKLAIEPGRHHIRVLKDGRVIVDRNVLVGDQQTMEISIP